MLLELCEASLEIISIGYPSFSTVILPSAATVHNATAH
jgi:hypothetical protein